MLTLQSSYDQATCVSYCANLQQFITFNSDQILIQYPKFSSISTIFNMKSTEAKSNQILSVSLGFPVIFSSQYQHKDCIIWRLDSLSHAWSPQTNNNQQWIQVCSPKPQLWIGVITQGRPNQKQWVEQYRVSYSSNGSSWEFVEGGRVFVGNSDHSTKVRNNFENGVVARAIRIHPTKWMNHISMRFDVIFLEA